ncbi:hypothetical protein HYW82_02025 [Candidatus Peregrinibacteria bacterium]|nr:hypothetical protein [Candidatus Peregrinibacteria bacterium]
MGSIDIIDDVQNLRASVIASIEGELAKYGSIGRRGGVPGIFRKFSEMRHAGVFDKEIMEAVLEADINVIGLTQCFNILRAQNPSAVREIIAEKAIAKAVSMAHSLDCVAIANIINSLPKLGVKKCPRELMERAMAVSDHMYGKEIAAILSALPKLGEGKCPKELIERAMAVSGDIGGQTIANIINSLPKLGVKKCPRELMERAIAVSGNMNSQAIANIISALLRLGEKKCPEWLIKRLLDEKIIIGRQFDQGVYERFVGDLRRFDNFDEIKSALAGSSSQVVRLLYEGLCVPKSQLREN